MKLLNTTNGGFVEVSEEFGERLIATGSWKKPTIKRTRKPAPKQETPENEGE